MTISVVTGADEEVLVCSAPTTGTTTARGGGALFFDGSAFGLGGTHLNVMDLP